MKKLFNLVDYVIRGLNFLAPIGDLVLRLWVANVFWRGGIVKLYNMDSTLWLFTHEYKVPCLPPIFAAYLGTGIEIGFSFLLAIGFLGRFSAGILSIFNLVAMFCAPGLNEVGFEWHMVWGIMLLIPLLRGPGKLSVDHFIWKRLMKNNPSFRSV
jgi:putative oxidoreductase